MLKRLCKPIRTGGVFDTILLIFQRQVSPASAENVVQRTTYKNPTTGEVVTGKENVLRLQESWNDARGIMSEIGFLDSLKAFDCSQVNDETIELLYPYLCAADFHPTDTVKVCRACQGLCDWVRALVARKAGVEALIANARARAATATSRPYPPRPIHPVAHMLLLGSVCASSSLVRLRGRTDELRMIFERVLSFSDRTAGPVAHLGSTAPRVTVTAASDAWADRAPPCPPLEPFVEGDDASKWADRLFGPRDSTRGFDPDGAPFGGTFLRPYVHMAYHGPDAKQCCLTADGRLFLSITESGWSQARDVPPDSQEWEALQRAGIFGGWARRALELHGRGHVMQVVQVVTELGVTFHVECRGTFFVSTDGTAEDPFRSSDERASTLLLAAIAEKGLRGADGKTPPPPIPPDAGTAPGFQPMGTAGEGRVELVLHDATYRLEIRSPSWQRDPVASIEIVDGAWTRTEWPPAWPADLPQKISNLVNAQRNSLAEAGEDPDAVEDTFCGNQRLWCDQRFPDVAVIRPARAEGEE